MLESGVETSSGMFKDPAVDFIPIYCPICSPESGGGTCLLARRYPHRVQVKNKASFVSIDIPDMEPLVVRTNCRKCGGQVILTFGQT